MSGCEIGRDGGTEREKGRKGGKGGERRGRPRERKPVKDGRIAVAQISKLRKRKKLLPR